MASRQFAPRINFKKGVKKTFNFLHKILQCMMCEWGRSSCISLFWDALPNLVLPPLSEHSKPVGRFAGARKLTRCATNLGYRRARASSKCGMDGLLSKPRRAANLGYGRAAVLPVDAEWLDIFFFFFFFFF